MELNKIYCEDCLDTMARMPDDYCDVFTDPPYNVNKDYGVYKDNLSDTEYENWITLVLNEIKRIGINITLLIPKKYNLLYWNILGSGYKEVILTSNPAGAIRHGFSNQFNKLLTNATPVKHIPNVWINIPQPSHGYYFKEDTFGHPGDTAETITGMVIKELTTHDIIYDPFMGSGTTAKMSHLLKRNWIGSEISQEYVDLANKRLQPYIDQKTLF